jgi:hypothetical protein
MNGLGQPLAPTDISPIQEPDLQRELIRIVDNNGWSEMVANGAFAITLVVLDNSKPYSLAGVNENLMLYAASLPKIAVLFAAMVAAQEGNLVIDPELEQDLHNMIRVSCNPCATTFQVARLYYSLVMGSFLDPEHTRKMLDCLARPGISHKFVKALKNEGELRLWRKSGSWRNFHADSILVESANGRYILVALVEAENGGTSTATAGSRCAPAGKHTLKNNPHSGCHSVAPLDQLVNAGAQGLVRHRRIFPQHIGNQGNNIVQPFAVHIGFHNSD